MTSWKIILSVLAFLCCSGLLVFLPSLRSKRWEHTHHSTKHQITPKTQEELNEELEIEKASAVDDSQFAQSLGIRYIQRIPTSKVALEAVFRQRRSDASVMLPPSEPLFVTRFLREPIGLEQSNKTMRLSATRRAVFSIGLEMHGSDIAQIPWLSRSTIVDFIQGHYVSLQTRILKDERSDEWFLHHRPIAAVAKFGAVPLTHEFVSPITETVADIRGLGVLIDRDRSSAISDASDQTAIWLFRSLRSANSTIETHYDYAFIRAFGNDSGPSRLSVILTTNNRTEWHCLTDSEVSRSPTRSSDTSTLGSVHFTEYASDGLHPKTSVTRSVRIKSKKSYRLDQIIEHLSSNGFDGDWGQHLLAILDFVASKPD